MMLPGYTTKATWFYTTESVGKQAPEARVLHLDHGCKTVTISGKNVLSNNILVTLLSNPFFFNFNSPLFNPKTALLNRIAVDHPLHPKRIGENRKQRTPWHPL